MWECSKCKEIIEEQFDACWNCGTKYGKNSRSFQEKVGNFLINSIPEGKMLSAKPTKKIEEYASSEEKIIHSNTNNTIEGVILTTTPTIESRMVKKYIGIVCGDAILGANVFRDILAGITDFVGFRSGVYESKLSKAREIALSEMARKAKDIGANAVLSISIDYETIRGSMLMVICTGTAVEIDIE